jgi:anti-sigma factor RsiW
MKKEMTEELFVKHIDGVLSAEEEAQLQVLMENDPEIGNELEAMKSQSESLRNEVPASVEPPYGDFFNSQLMRKVDLEVESQRPSKKAERWWTSLRWAWAPAGALALVLSFFAGHRVSRPADETSQAVAAKAADSLAELPTVYFAGEALEAKVISDSVIVVNGLSAIPDEINFQTVTTSTTLPSAYETAEARRFQ